MPINQTQTTAYLTWLVTDCKYRDVRLLSDGRWAATNQFLFTAAILVGRVGGQYRFDDCWCYHNGAAARAALDAWDGTGEPKGWHRHPATGRRVMPDGTEEVFA